MNELEAFVAETDRLEDFLNAELDQDTLNDIPFEDLLLKHLYDRSASIEEFIAAFAVWSSNYDGTKTLKCLLDAIRSEARSLHSLLKIAQGKTIKCALPWCGRFFVPMRHDQRFCREQHRFTFHNKYPDEN